MIDHQASRVIPASGAFLWILPTHLGKAADRGALGKMRSGRLRRVFSGACLTHEKWSEVETSRYFFISSLREPGQNDRRRKAAPASLAPRIPDMLGEMEQRMTALERAFQLARSGRVAGVTDIITLLNREGYYGSQIEGRHLKRQLADLIKAARSVNPTGSRGVDND